MQTSTPTTRHQRPAVAVATRVYGFVGGAHTTATHVAWFHKAITTHRRPGEDALH